jgi:hypothetical protein
MAVTEYKFPGTAANVDNGGYMAWSNVDNIKADDSNNALVLTNSNPDKNTTDYLTATNFGFTSTDIPAGATINGIEFVINRRGSEADSQYDYKLYMLKAGTQHGDNLASATYWPTSLTDATYGGATSLLGGTWAQTDIVGVTTFGFQLAIKNHISSDAGEWTYVEHVKLRVYYTEGGATGSQPLKNVFGRPFRGVFR